MSGRERLQGGSRAREGVRALPGYAACLELWIWVVSYASGWGHIGSNVNTREASRGLSGPRGDLGVPWVCLELWILAVSDVSARARLGPHWIHCQDERGFTEALES